MLVQLDRADAVVAAIIIGREITISALREWMAKIGAARNVAVSMLGVQIKTAAQMAAIPLLLYAAPLADTTHAAGRRVADLAGRSVDPVVDGLLPACGLAGDRQAGGRLSLGYTVGPAGRQGSGLCGEYIKMSEREVDQALVERAQGGDQKAFDQLVSKYQRKLERLLSRYVRDAAEVEDVAQEAFIKAYRRCRVFAETAPFTPGCIASALIPPRIISLPRGDVLTSTGFDAEEAEGGRCRPAARHQHAGKPAHDQADRRKR